MTVRGSEFCLPTAHHTALMVCAVMREAARQHEDACRMRIEHSGVHFRYKAVDSRTLDGEPLLSRVVIADNLLLVKNVYPTLDPLYQVRVRAIVSL